MRPLRLIPGVLGNHDYLVALLCNFSPLEITPQSDNFQTSSLAQ
jgi:hypothetical protein